MSVPSFLAVVHFLPGTGICAVIGELGVPSITDERFEAFAHACGGDDVVKVADATGMRIEGYTCNDPANPLMDMWALAELMHAHFGIETDVAAPRAV